MKKTIPFLLIIITLVITSCNRRDSMVKEIEKMENDLKADTNAMPPAESVKAVQALYFEFADKFPTDSLSPDYLFKAADLSIFLRDYTTTIGLYDRLLTEHQNYSKLPQALFMKAFVYDQYIQDPMKASEFFRQFISLYPDHELADDASQALLFCGKTDAEILEILQQRSATDSIPAESTPR